MGKVQMDLAQSMTQEQVGAIVRKSLAQLALDDKYETKEELKRVRDSLGG
jgi:hypothetical protein